MKRLVLSNAEAAELIEERASELAEAIDLMDDQWGGDDEDSRVVVYDGNVRIDGDFAVGPEPTIVLGSLEVTGWLSDVNEADVSLLAVSGNVKADRALFLSQVNIMGDLKVKTLIYANSLNDFSLEVGGDLVAAGLVEEGSFCWIGSEVKSPLVLSMQNAIVQGDDENPVVERRGRPVSEVFRPEFIEDDYPSMDKVRAAMKTNAPILVGA
jgi:hypothetical protein